MFGDRPGVPVGAENPAFALALETGNNIGHGQFFAAERIVVGKRLLDHRIRPLFEQFDEIHPAAVVGGASGNARTEGTLFEQVIHGVLLIEGRRFGYGSRTADEQGHRQQYAEISIMGIHGSAI